MTSPGRVRRIRGGHWVLVGVLLVLAGLTAWGVRARGGGGEVPTAGPHGTAHPPPPPENRRGDAPPGPPAARARAAGPGGRVAHASCPAPAGGGGPRGGPRGRHGPAGAAGLCAGGHQAPCRQRWAPRRGGRSPARDGGPGGDMAPAPPASKGRPRGVGISP